MRSLYERISSIGQRQLSALYRERLSSVPVPSREKTVDTWFGTTHIVLLGNPNGKPVFVLHDANAAYPFNLRAFCKHLDLEQLQFIVPVTIGDIGLSAETRLSASNVEYGMWASDVLDALGVDSIPVLGGSFGGDIALRLAMYAPARITRLMLFVPSGIQTANWAYMAKIGMPVISNKLSPMNDEKLQQTLLPWVPSPSESDLELAKLRLLHTKFKLDIPKNLSKYELRNLTAPVYIIADKDDRLFPGKAVLQRAPKLFENLVGTMLLFSEEQAGLFTNEETHFDYYDTVNNFLLQE